MSKKLNSTEEELNENAAVVNEDGEYVEEDEELSSEKSTVEVIEHDQLVLSEDLIIKFEDKVSKVGKPFTSYTISHIFPNGRKFTVNVEPGDYTGYKSLKDMLAFSKDGVMKLAVVPFVIKDSKTKKVTAKGQNYFAFTTSDDGFTDKLQVKPRQPSDVAALQCIIQRLVAGGK